MKAEISPAISKRGRFVDAVMSKLVPLGLREYLGHVKENGGTIQRVVLEYVALLPRLYYHQVARAFNRYGCAAAMLVVIFCFGVAARPSTMTFLVVVIVAGLTVREGYLHNAKRKNVTTPGLQRVLDSAGDAALALLFAMAAQMFIMQVSPASALPTTNLLRGAILCVALLFSVKLALRQKPDPDAPLFDEKMDPEMIHSHVKRLNRLWLVTYWGVVCANVTDIPYYWLDPVRGFEPIFTFKLWWVMQKDLIGRFDNLRLRIAKIEETRIGAMLANAAKGLLPGEPFYVGYVVVEVLMYLTIAVSVADASIPWLSGEPGSFFRAFGAMVAGVTAILSWQYVKATNRAAAKAMREHLRQKRLAEQPR